MPTTLPNSANNTLPELTQLKLLPPEERAEIASWQDVPEEEVCQRIAQRWSIPLSSPSVLARFQTWQRRQAVWDHLSEMTEQDEAALQDRFPGSTREQLREAAIRRAYAAADALDDPALALKVVQEDLADSRNRREWQKFRRETCELFLKWFADTQVRAIAESAATDYSGKIEALGRLLFREDWKP